MDSRGGQRGGRGEGGGGRGGEGVRGVKGGRGLVSSDLISCREGENFPRDVPRIKISSSIQSINQSRLLCCFFLIF